MMSKDNVQANIQKIRSLFPNAVTEVLRDGVPTLAVDFDVLKQELSNVLIDDKEERYEFTWPDKKKSKLLANSPISATLRPCKEESVDFDNTENLYIEGDNLDVLKLLQETYLGKIKMIYIDPPYNTGNDFVYNDDFSESSDEYLACSGQYDEQGNRLVQNTESNGRFHTDWLNMIYPRLKVARDLLSDDGVIFISIDDNEQANLKKICDEIYGESNLICQFVWKSKPQGGNDNPHIVTEHEYVVCYSKNISNISTNGRPIDPEKYKSIDEYFSERGKYALGKLDLSTLGYRENLDYAIIAPDGSEVYPGGVNKEEHVARKKRNSNLTNDWQWRWSKERFDKAFASGFIEMKQDKHGKWTVYAKEYQNVDRDGHPIKRAKKYRTIIDDVTTVDGTTEIRNLVGNRVFTFPKPTKLLHKFLDIMATTDALVLDFFSGSASLAQAIMELNATHDFKIKYILVQIPEKTPIVSEAKNAGYKNICEIGKERIRRAGKKIKEESPLTSQDLDIGFRVLKLDSSNMKDVYYKSADYSQSLLDTLEDNIKEDRTPLDLLFQVMLELGKPLSATIEEKEIAGKRVFIVDDNDLIACFDKDVNEETIKAIAQLKPLYAVFRDNSFSTDTVATNFDQIFATYSPNTTRRVL